MVSCREHAAQPLSVFGKPNVEYSGADSTMCCVLTPSPPRNEVTFCAADDMWLVAMAYTVPYNYITHFMGLSKVIVLANYVPAFSPRIL